jgi:hypothetical protein
MIYLPANVRSLRPETDRARYWLEKFERMRAGAGFRPTSIHADQDTALHLGECVADEVLRIAAANDD